MSNAEKIAKTLKNLGEAKVSNFIEEVRNQLEAPTVMQLLTQPHHIKCTMIANSEKLTRLAKSKGLI